MTDLIQCKMREVIRRLQSKELTHYGRALIVDEKAVCVGRPKTNAACFLADVLPETNRAFFVYENGHSEVQGVAVVLGLTATRKKRYSLGQLPSGKEVVFCPSIAVVPGVSPRLRDEIIAKLALQIRVHFPKYGFAIRLSGKTSGLPFESYGWQKTEEPEWETTLFFDSAKA